MLKALLGALPAAAQSMLRQVRDAALIRTGRFSSAEPEVAALGQLLLPGDWVLDIGANYGTYTVPLSRAVGAKGRVVAIEPVATTFAHLAVNVRAAGCANVTLLNVAASARPAELGMEIPSFPGAHRPNPYMAHIAENGPFRALSIAIDDLCLPRPVRLAKIDVEGYEGEVLKGMLGILRRDRPVLIVEGFAPDVDEILRPLDYSPSHTDGSPNRVFIAPSPPTRSRGERPGTRMDN